MTSAIRDSALYKALDRLIRPADVVPDTDDLVQMIDEHLAEMRLTTVRSAAKSIEDQIKGLSMIEPSAKAGYEDFWQLARERAEAGEKNPYRVVPKTSDMEIGTLRRFGIEDTPETAAAACLYSLGWLSALGEFEERFNVDPLASFEEADVVEAAVHAAFPDLPSSYFG
ncbi:hypothetical protein [Roseomonas genomospecies 6]|uniref:Uncharacterized protein n=1 Tax=Roseomonas genomospecies 6 TaxID=214106 RepID=A0A9W7KQI0_9PROT|nr:hypothetical protein [Roseomonas genomospecies 6]KAA0677672.1 hypothetical protein DS843_22805 [Roseomonas genomospecies 6]